MTAAVAPRTRLESREASSTAWRRLASESGRASDGNSAKFPTSNLIRSTDPGTVIVVVETPSELADAVHAERTHPTMTSLATHAGALVVSGNSGPRRFQRCRIVVRHSSEVADRAVPRGARLRCGMVVGHIDCLRDRRSQPHPDRMGDHPPRPPIRRHLRVGPRSRQRECRPERRGATRRRRACASSSSFDLDEIAAKLGVRLPHRLRLTAAIPLRDPLT
jgi:hypothetical protein